MPESAQTVRSVAVRRPSQQRARATNNPRQMAVSGNTVLGRRMRDIADMFAVELGGWSALTDRQAMNVRRAAELRALVEQQRAAALQGAPVDLTALSQVEGKADKAERILRLPTDGRAEAPGQAFDGHLARLASEDA